MSSQAKIFEPSKKDVDIHALIESPKITPSNILTPKSEYARTPKSPSRTPKPGIKSYCVVVRKDRNIFKGFFPLTMDKRGKVIIDTIFGVGRTGSDPEQTCYTSIRKAVSFDNKGMEEFKIKNVHHEYKTGISHWLAVTSRKTPTKYTPNKVATGNNGWVVLPLDIDHINNFAEQRGWNVSPHIDTFILLLQDTIDFWRCMGDSLDAPFNNVSNMTYQSSQIVRGGLRH